MPSSVVALHNYSVQVETWTTEDSETLAMLDYRMMLHASLNTLSAVEREQLARSDRKARALVVAHRHDVDPYDDIATLADMVELIERERPRSGFHSGQSCRS